MWIQKAEIVDGKIKYNKLGIVRADELEPGIADKYFIYEQITASNEWYVQHNLQKRPSVNVIDSTGTVVYGLVQYLSDNELKIIFKYSFAGIAYCN